MVVSFYVNYSKLPLFPCFFYFFSILFFHGKILFTEPKENLSEVKNILVDAGYTGENFATQIKTTIGTTVEVIKRSELHTFVVLPKR
jgi:hypothetical protein